jgi:hypothetical protein
VKPTQAGALLALSLAWLLRAAFVACFALCALSGTATSSEMPGEIAVRLEPLKATVKEGEEIGMLVVFMGGAHDTTLILPARADPTGIITYRAIEVASGREWAAENRDVRSFAADARRRVPAGGKIELHHDVLDFRGPENPLVGQLPAGTYRIVGTYDEGKAFRPENRTSRVLRSEPVEIVVTAR